MSKNDRETHIIQGAIRFFADNGFSGTTRDLAAHLGVVHGLLYRYFPTKDALVERVYLEVFERAWNQEWVALLKDRSRPLRDRLITFCSEYARTIRDNEWVRIFLRAGFAGLEITHRYRALIRKRFFPIVIAETRHALGLNPLGERQLSDVECSLMYVLHGGLFYIDIGKWAFGSSLRVDDTPLIGNLVDIFIAGANEMLAGRSKLL